MPFTFSHPAIILPLNYLPKNWISLTGLVIGSIVPDFEYFLRMKIQSDYSHTFLGVLWFDLPFGIILTFLFHNFVKKELFNNLPKELNARFKIAHELHWNAYFIKKWVVVIASIFIGTLSHLFWDSFTHDSGFFVKKFGELQSTILILGKPVKILKVLQHSSTIIGGFLIAYAIYKLPKSAISKTEINFKYWVFLTIFTILIFVVRVICGDNATKIGNVIVSLISALMIGLVFTPILLKRNDGI
ncbi:DUF4184 family protein [Flavobacterium sp.]|jgi:hypothetical protein|uniref:DUF4184 family protein n=1 Tax=Flavobacterium sp. TaxID=239 RepID=UPI0037C1B3F6